jgi:hypothetical protein
MPPTHFSDALSFDGHSPELLAEVLVRWRRESSIKGPI